jgi:hypothetical protein
MTDIKHHYYIVLLLFLLPGALRGWQGQTIPRQSVSIAATVSIPIIPNDTSYYLPRGYITQNSEKIWVDSLALLTKHKDYEINYDLGIITLYKNRLAPFVLDSVHHRIVVQYLPLPFSFRREYALRELVIRDDSAGLKKITVTGSGLRFDPNEFFGKGFQKSGTLMRGFTIGSNQDLTLNSGFRMQLNGALSKEINVTAALTDENSPIQPEGTTQTLREVDKVFVNLQSKHFGATLGDFNLAVSENQGGEFGRLSRKLQGASATALFENLASGNLSASAILTAATARGKFATNYFQGLDGSQGPFRVTGNNGEPQIVVVAGTERVYLNGELMTRGELNDYTVEYASGDVLFTNRRMITSASRITIDFEYSDQQYTRNLVSVTTGETAWNNKVRFNAIVSQEADDPDSPIDFTLDDPSREVLRHSGSEQLLASLPGTKYVGVDSVGVAKGQYVQRDSLINGKTYHILIFAPGDPKSLYSATFSSVQAMPPDSAGYTRVASGQYSFAGIGQGNYLPIQLLPMPQLHRSIDFNGSYAVTPDLSLSGEYAATRFDQNRFSPPELQSNSGGAMKFMIQFKPKVLTLFDRNFGELRFELSDRYVDRTFAPLDRFNDVEFSRDWNLTNQTNSNEEIREGSLTYVPMPILSLGGGYGLLDRMGETKSLRTHGELELKDSTLPALRYNVENISNDDYVGHQNSTWLRQRATTEYRLMNITPSLGVESENRSVFGTSKDSLAQGAFRILQIAPRVGVNILGPISGSVEIQSRIEDSSTAGRLSRASRSLNQLYMWQLSEWRNLSSSLSFKIRSVSFSEEFRRHGNTDGEFILVRSQSRYAPLDRAVESDLYYEFDSQRSSRLERVYLRVPKGTGNYVYAGDLNGNGIADDNEFQLTKYEGDYVVIYVPSERLYPVVDLKASMRLRVQPARILRNVSTFWERALKALSTETYVRVEENSSDPTTKHIYLLNLGYFQNDSTTISGSSQVQQDLFIFENDPALSFRFRYNQTNGFVQLVSSGERSFLREQSVRIRSQLGVEIGNQTDIVNKLDRVNSSQPSSRERDISSNSLTSDFSYRPEIQWEIGFNFSVSRSVDNFNLDNTTADINGQGIRVTYGILGVGQLRSEFSREEVVVSNIHSDPIRGIPFELTNGSAIGKNYLWQLAFDYRINQNMQVSLQYNGRSEGGRPPVHLARAEARAFF